MAQTDGYVGYIKRHVTAQESTTGEVSFGLE
jgi:hypothetical protein